jgi:heme-degrading monooxygenase HmoA
MDEAWEHAVKGGDAGAVGELLNRGAEVNALDRYGQTGLMLAAHAGHRDVVETLLARGAELDVTAKFGLSALMLAVVAGHPEIASLLARAGADRSLRGSGAEEYDGKTAFDLAVARDMHELSAELRLGVPNDQDFAVTPSPPYHAVIFCSRRSDGDQGYSATADRMVELARAQPGFLGVESARGANGFGITVSYWVDEDAVTTWKQHAEHLIAQERGRSQWYTHYEIRVTRVERAYGMPCP